MFIVIDTDSEEAMVALAQLVALRQHAPEGCSAATDRDCMADHMREALQDLWGQSLATEAL